MAIIFEQSLTQPSIAWLGLGENPNKDSLHLLGFDSQPNLGNNWPQNKIQTIPSERGTQRYRLTMLHPKRQLAALQTNSLARLFSMFWGRLLMMIDDCLSLEFQCRLRLFAAMMLPRLPITSRKKSSHRDCTSMLPVQHHLMVFAKVNFYIMWQSTLLNN